LFHALGAWRIAPGFHDILWNQAFTVPASQLLEGPVRFWHDQLFCEPARHSGVVAWHQDVSKRHLTPGPAIWLCVVVAFMAAVYAGAYPVVTSISVIGLYFSYIIPVFLAWRARGRGNEPARGPWNLGRWGAAVNVIAIVWVVFISIVLSTPDNMRPGKTIAGFVVLLVLWYLLRERRRFKGPAFAQRRDE
jgi:amino acid transporter